MICDKMECYLCGRTGTLQRHHCLHGSRRKMADRYDLTVYLCPECHRRLHDLGEYDLMLEQLAQRHFEDSHSHAEYMDLFHKNYLERG